MPTDSSMPCVLIVDDEADALEISRRLVEKAAPGTRVTPALGARAAMAHLLRASDPQDLTTRMPDLILLDLNMPGMDGFELLRWVRSNRMLAAVKVVMLTSSDASADIKRATGLGAHGYLIKYPNPSCLASLLKQAVLGAGTSEEQRAAPIDFGSSAERSMAISDQPWLT